MYSSIEILLMPERDSFDPSFWGPITWKVLYISVLSYPSSHPSSTVRSHYAMFLKSLKTTLPCQKCRDGVDGFLKSHPVEPALISRVELLKWLTSLYNGKRRDDKSKIKKISDLKKMLDGDETINDILNKLEKHHPKLKLG